MQTVSLIFAVEPKHLFECNFCFWDQQIGSSNVNKPRYSITFLDKCWNWVNLHQDECLDTVWYFSFSITQSVWELSLTQEEYLCSCYWIMSFKQISNTFPLKQQTVHFQFPWQCVPPSAGPVSCLWARPVLSGLYEL